MMQRVCVFILILLYNNELVSLSIVIMTIA